ncbi:3-deoxy-D-manno-octulosonic acid transferase [Turneriella parva]|uniref:3-deoxy-D-manno-octulosonic acid transferase n=1 Tax=Turneriella parva (strain ATCC BAA-1111 / DSM 21527 / NCTC 11395 / H) TaxID=869212 RepID=I4B5M5_TURPD|nr:glycosyltransferase N-terminal domain-containing protein [Turneriella parva]AFM12582.1 Three-deoxy-D-manno-octulosonic-acid transferase domain-containing protein [Turneriella parva DSM 21527]
MWFYNLLLYTAYPLLWLVSRWHKRLGKNFDLRKKLPDFSAARGKRHIWFHASSAGEFEQVRALAIEMRKVHKDFFFSFSFFSDSAWRARKNDPVPDAFFALPFDFRRRMQSLVVAMKPDALVIGKYDAWPNQVKACFAAGVPVYVISATLPEKSSRHRFPLRVFLAGIYRPMRAIFAINGDHAARLKKISPHNVTVAGDTRFDAISYRLKEGAKHAKAVQALRRQLGNRHVIVGGSSYATSEKLILQFVRAVNQTGNKKFAAVIAPHHVQPQRIAAIEQQCLDSGLTTAKWSDAKRAQFDVLIVDALGVLPYLYDLATVAYVGGGFEGSVHSVIEAAIAGAPIVTGPHLANSAEAIELQGLGLLTSLEAPEAPAFYAAVENLCKTRAATSKQLKAYFRQRVGVSRRILHTVMDDLYKQ